MNELNALQWGFVIIICAVCAFVGAIVVQDALLRRAQRKEAERQAENEKALRDEQEYWAKERAKRPIGNPIHSGAPTAQKAVAAMKKQTGEKS